MGSSKNAWLWSKKCILAEIKVAKVKIPLFRYFVPPPDFFQVRRGPCLCIKWLQFCTVKVRYLGCTRGRFLLRQASQNLELFAKILPSNENNTAAGMARYLVSAAEANFFNRWSLVFICHASLARTQYLIQRLWIIDEISFKSKVECCKIGIYMKVLSTTL